jgi:hypothetical protein
LLGPFGVSSPLEHFPLISLCDFFTCHVMTKQSV